MSKIVEFGQNYTRYFRNNILLVKMGEYLNFGSIQACKELEEVHEL
jgi:hypothetical protein